MEAKLQTPDLFESRSPMSDIIRNILYRAPRFQIGSDQAIEAVIERAAAGGVESIEAEVVDISCGGAKMRLPQPVSLDGAVTMNIKAGKLPRTISVAADVCWTRLAGADQRWVGLSFKPAIPEAVLTDWAQAGCLDRRQHLREEIVSRWTAQWELDSSRVPVRLLDLSTSGLCLLSQQEGTPGECVLLQPDPPDGHEVLVKAKAQWQIETDDGYVIGCEFVNKHGHATLRAVIDLEEPAAPPPSPWWRRFLWPR